MNNHLLRIAFVIDDLGYGGAQRQLSTICPGFEGIAEPRVYCLSERVEPFAGPITEKGIRVKTFRRRGNVDPARLASLTRAFARDGVDVVHGFLDASNIYAALAARRNRIPHVLSLRAQTHFIGGFKKWLLWRLLRRAGRVTVNSRAGSRYLAQTVGVAPERIVIVPNAIGPVPVSTRERGAVPVVGFVGRLVELKRVDLLIDAFALLVARFPGARLVIVGDGPLRATLEARTRRLGIDERVEWAGNVNDVPARLAGMDCLALPSRSEGFPNAAMEALAAGVPVVASPAGDVEQLVREGETGCLLTNDTPEALCGLIARVLEDEQLRTRVRTAGPSRIAADYSVDAAVNTLMRVYTALAGPGA